QVSDGRLGSVGAPVEHRLAAEEPAQRHAVEAADQRVALPDLHTVGEAAAVKIAVRAQEIARDPGRGAIVAALRAGTHHLAERTVDAEPPSGATGAPTDRAV